MEVHIVEVHIHLPPPPGLGLGIGSHKKTPIAGGSGGGGGLVGQRQALALREQVRGPLCWWFWYLC